jgi:hypothetical protein
MPPRPPGAGLGLALFLFVWRNVKLDGRWVTWRKPTGTTWTTGEDAEGGWRDGTGTAWSGEWLACKLSRSFRMDYIRTGEAEGRWGKRLANSRVLAKHGVLTGFTLRCVGICDRVDDALSFLMTNLWFAVVGSAIAQHRTSSGGASATRNSRW